jgi:CheY-like chemotaxis protein
VLLIDDEADIRAAMTGLLRFHAIDVRTVADEAGALDELARAEAERSPSTCCCATTGWPTAPTGWTPACACSSGWTAACPAAGDRRDRAAPAAARARVRRAGAVQAGGGREAAATMSTLVSAQGAAR